MSQLVKYKKLLLNRLTITQSHPVVQYIENCMAAEDEVFKYSLHKITIQNWGESSTVLFEVISEYFGVVFVPLNYTKQNVLTAFHTTSLMLLLKIIKSDFMFPYNHYMFYIDIYFNDKTSTELFGEKITINEVVSQVVSLRFNEHCELNLSNLCNDEELAKKKIVLYKLSLLSYFKILMIRMGRDTKILNLSNNNLSQVPLNILNFFVKGELIGLNLSNNNIPLLSGLQRVSSKIEKLWVEGNPLCADLEPMTYIKQISQKFPRITELDGVKLNEHGLMIPFYTNFLITPDKKTKMLIENFVSLYFAHYDSKRQKIDMFYEDCAHLTLSNTFTEADENTMQNYVKHSRNILNPLHKTWDFKFKRIYKKKAAVIGVLTQLPVSMHDPHTFTIDVLRHDNNQLIVVIEGIFKENPNDYAEQLLHFRRTFVFNIHSNNVMSHYNIVCEMFTVSFPTPEMKRNSFKHPVRHINQLTLINPDKEERNMICAAFMHLTQLKKSEAEARLLFYDWDIKIALKAFTSDLKNNKINEDKLMVDEEISDISSLLDDEVD